MSGQLQNGEQQFFDNNGKPLNGGTIDFYVPNTTTRKTTWQDQALTIQNTNPIVLDAGGRAIIWGNGSYRQVLKDNHGNLIWDQVVSDPVTSLLAKTGASQIGADDGTGGSIFTTVAGFIVALASSIGSSLVGFIQAGTGAISRTAQDKMRERVSVKDFGAIGNDLNDDYAAIVKARDYCLSTTPYKQLYFPAGNYRISQTLSFDFPGISVRGDGKHASIIHCTGTGVAVQFTNVNPNNGIYAFGGDIKQIGIEGNANTTRLLLINFVNHFLAEDINLREASISNGIGLEVLGCVLSDFKNITCSTNEQLMSSRPNNGIIVSDSDGARATGCKFDNVVIEGMVGDGIQIINSDGCIFIGGTSENNGGNSITNTFGRMNTFIGVSMEKGSPPGFAQIYDNAYGSRYINCYTNQLIYFDTASQFIELVGGFHQSIESHGDFATIHDLKYSFFGSGGTVIVKSNNSTRNLFNADISALTFSTKSPIIVSVTDSPYTYTNVSGLDEEVIVSGGTVSQIVLDRSGPVTTLPTSGMYRLAPNDKLVISYTVVPTVVTMPFGTNYI